MRNLLLLICLCTLVFACKQSTTSSNAEIPAVTEVKIPDGPLAKKLYANYHASPASQTQKDENRLIEYAVANNIEVTRTASGLYHSIKKSTDLANYTTCTTQPCPKITANYKGMTLEGKEFDNSYKRGAPLVFAHGQMIPGWNEALLLMNPGASATLLIPSHLAYGTRGFPGLIGPNEPLVFNLETLEGN